MTLIFLDVETTGLDPKTNSIIQLAGIITKNNKETERFNFRIKPYRGEVMDPVASEKTGISNETAYSYPDQSEVFIAFKEICDKYVSKYSDKMYLVGYNVGFDDNFMRSWFELNGYNWGYEVWFPYIDVMNLAALKMIGRRVSMRSFKLVDVYRKFMGKNFENAHDAFADIVATKKLFDKFFMELVLLPELRVPVRKGKKEVSEENDEIPF